MPSISSRLWSSVVALARGIPSEFAARVKLLASTMRTNVRIAMMRSITGVSPMDLEAPRSLVACGAYACSQSLNPPRLASGNSVRLRAAKPGRLQLPRYLHHDEPRHNDRDDATSPSCCVLRRGLLA